MIDRLAVIQAEAEQFAAVLAETPGQTRVPTCTDWDASDLLWHLTEVHLFWAGVLRSGALTDDDVAVLEAAIPARPETLDDAFALRRQATEDLIDALEELDDAQPRWSWWEPEQTVGFTRRMQTYEATMHRVDAERAAGLEPGPIADEVAAGAVDHCADVMWGWGRGSSIGTQGDPEAIAAMQDVVAAGTQ